MESWEGRLNEIQRRNTEGHENVKRSFTRELSRMEARLESIEGQLMHGQHP